MKSIKIGLSVVIGMVVFATSILVMIYGWGLQPQSFGVNCLRGWIVGGGITTLFLLAASISIGDLE